MCTLSTPDTLTDQYQTADKLSKLVPLAATDLDFVLNIHQVATDPPVQVNAIVVLKMSAGCVNRLLCANMFAALTLLGVKRMLVLPSQLVLLPPSGTNNC